MEQPLPQCWSTNSVLRAFFPRVAIGCRLSLKIDRNLSPSLAGTLSVATWYDSALNRRYGIWTNIYTDLCDWQMIGRCPVPRAVPVPISLRADAHFGARLGAFFYWTGCFESNVPFYNTTTIYLINLLWKLVLGFRLDSELPCFSIFHGE